MAAIRPSKSLLTLPFLLLSLSSPILASPQPQPNAMPQPQDDDGNGNDLFGPDGPPAASTSTPDQMQSDSDNQDRFHYYLIIIIIAILGVLGLAILLVTRRRKRAELAARARLVGDMEAQRGQGFGSVRQGTHRSQTWGIQMGSWGVGAPGARNPGEVRMEGLDERGEAPPPYEPKRDSDNEGHISEDGSATVVSALGDTDEHGIKAPQYEEVVLERPELTHRPNSRRDEHGDEAMATPVRTSSTSR